MKTIAYIVAAVALVAAGWFIGRHTASYPQAAAKTEQSSVASQVFKDHLFNSAYTEVTFCQTVIAQLDSGRLDDAKQMLRTHQDGCIFELDNSLDPAAISSEDMVALRDLNASIQSSHESKRETANQILARVAQWRTNHPWAYKGDLPHSTDPEVEAKLASILKRASENQK
jgi:hypothetical protein